ncbi:hypothetical protein [Sphingosinicella sp. BN140058]|uniref:hypothetical protein n=1 Tax=Sphingosinicella sp. BN140058 TaxID=1892855 RepID=UPI001013B6A1|nr:hypothetical protein [Sphingosinicella sp. BN140058]QAY80225.1 hypothetical protein ETR14_26645 [Sphingosinicella sp. BN140058]
MLTLSGRKTLARRFRTDLRITLAQANAAINRHWFDLACADDIDWREVTIDRLTDTCISLYSAAVWFANVSFPAGVLPSRISPGSPTLSPFDADELSTSTNQDNLLEYHGTIILARFHDAAPDCVEVTVAPAAAGRPVQMVMAPMPWHTGYDLLDYAAGCIGVPARILHNARASNTAPVLDGVPGDARLVEFVIPQRTQPSRLAA